MCQLAHQSRSFVAQMSAHKICPFYGEVRISAMAARAQANGPIDMPSRSAMLSAVDVGAMSQPGIVSVLLVAVLTNIVRRFPY
jgi:hypothetical protein